MKNAIRPVHFFGVLLLCLVISNFSASAQKTTIYLVRHAETPITLPKADDPALSQTGQQRANELAKKLKGKHIKAIYVTKLKSSGLTARPLAVKARILPRVYEADSAGIRYLAKALLKNFQGSNVLIIADANSLMPLLSALGADTPFAAVSEQDYDMLYTVTIKENGDTELDLDYYGQKHHENEIPEKYLPEISHPENIRPFTNY
ncbi:histidine phosphatase family protein [Mucilaginibacter achroorhodeus]|uniref:Histidine phosphatase family protein n=1 Tax=Mucilaginibacter achroorhodeus TaxID=2599294 RepID=A0A563UBR2_9SPHI|nr:phosphoglycerate mutase family protein [Mucilaginibacter achroorhodeus]TWR28699.1 histidine phosphatase family protein [Mucilaginibacter achroorhodeus]